MVLYGNNFSSNRHQNYRQESYSLWGKGGSGKELVSCLPERAYHLESCSDSCDNISQRTGHYKINEASPKLEMINVT